MGGAPSRGTVEFALRPGAAMVPTDVCVPISRLAECVTETQHDIAESRILAPIVGHVGDGNFHLTLLVDMDDADEVRRAKACRSAWLNARLRWTGLALASMGLGKGK